MFSAAAQRWEYRDTATPLPLVPEPAAPSVASPPPVPGLTEEQVAARIATTLAEAEQRWAGEASRDEALRREQLELTLQAFAEERARYFRAAETQVVHLALAVARKILGREATQDPELLQALVHRALDRMGAGPAIKLRVPSAEVASWQPGKARVATAFVYEVSADPALAPGACIVETDLGIADFSFEAQFKEIEQGMLDLLQLRPNIKKDAHKDGSAEALALAGESR